MANSTASIHTTATRTTTSNRTKRKPLSPARVYQAWAADCSQHGKRGSYRRTAELVGCSPEYIRQLVAKHEAAHTLKPELFTTAELDYMPAPGERPLARPIQPPASASTEASTNPTDDCATYVKPNSDLNVAVASCGESPQTATDIEAQPSERATVVLPVVETTTAASPSGHPTTALPSTLLPGATVKRSYPPRPAPARWDALQLLGWLRDNLGGCIIVATLVLMGLAAIWK
jgi:hypothetical protein